MELHLDSCPSCTRALALVAKIFASAAPGGSSTAPERDGTTTPTTGTEVGRYRVERELASGGMGVVFIAFDPALGRRVALKLLRAELLFGEDAEEASARLSREAQAMARVSSPHVVPVYDVGTFEGRPFLAMELVDGVTLRQWLAQEPRSPRAILDMFAQAGEGLAAAHAQGLVHRDFKPENVLVTRDGHAKVTDFGLTRVDVPVAALADPYRMTPGGAGELPADPLTSAGRVLGTPAYMSPEQFFGQPVDARSDVFSFAACLYEALYGTRPFQARNLDELRWRLASGRLESPRRTQGVPSWVREVLAPALAVDPSVRPASIRALLDALSAVEARRARLHVNANLVVQGVLLLSHLWMLSLFLIALVSSGSASTAAESTAPTVSHGEFDGPGWNFLAAIIITVLFSNVFWAPVGVLWVPVNLYGLLRRRAWARMSSLVYAAFAIPTCIGAPYAIYAFFSLTRPHVKRLFRA